MLALESSVFVDVEVISSRLLYPAIQWGALIGETLFTIVSTVGMALLVIGAVALATCIVKGVLYITSPEFLLSLVGRTKGIISLTSIGFHSLYSNLSGLVSDVTSGVSQLNKMVAVGYRHLRRGVVLYRNVRRRRSF
jgi:hypothetical protein